jgi:hypothetical protein
VVGEKKNFFATGKTDGHKQQLFLAAAVDAAGKSQNYLNPGFIDHCLALAWIHQGDYQQKQQDRHGKNENLVCHQSM